MDSSSSVASTCSILDTLGSDIIGVMSPVSICMFLVVLIVSAFSSDPNTVATDTSAAIPTAATLVYQESPSDPPSQKLEGALLNAVAFVALVTAVTFLLLLLYYYNFTRFLKYYMRFSAFFVLASMGGSIIISLLRRFSFALDSATFGLILFNFAAVGVFAVLSSKGFPIVMRQGYMVSLGIIVAAWLTKLPEWTTWSLLIALAIYDLVAVLTPGGPLKLLVELASSRDEELPAFVYEARPAVASATRQSLDSSIELQPLPVPAAASTRRSADRSINIQPVPATTIPYEVVNVDVEATDNADQSVVEIENIESETSPLVANANGDSEGRVVTGEIRPHLESEEEVFDTTRGIRLGLGDFVFYSVLVGRAALYDWMTVYACYLAIVSGLGCTLILLSVYRKALPALPISIMLGVGFYFLTRLLMEPFMVGASSNLVKYIKIQGFVFAISISGIRWLITHVIIIY